MANVRLFVYNIIMFSSADRDAPDTIAIVGMSCRFADAPNPGVFWRNIMDARSSLTMLGKEAALPFGARPLFEGAVYPSVAGQLGPLYACIPAQQRFPRQMNKGENQDLYFAVQLAFDALVDAGMRPRSRERVRGTVRFAYAPMFNVSTVNWLEHTFFVDQTMELLRRFFPHAPAENMENVRGHLLESLPAPNADSFVAAAGHRMVDWIARECSFSGAATTVDAGVVSSSAALEQAIDDLTTHRADVALVGALMPPLSTSLLQGLSGNIQFTDARELAPFARDARGTVPGEGGAFFVLKRRRDALATKDRIYALVRSAVSGEADTAELLAQAVSSASRPKAEVPVNSIQLIEADGSGIAAEDAAEVASVLALWGEHRAGDPLVGIGSVKGNIGHCMRAAGAASIMKAALALNTRVLPPQIAADRPVEALASRESPAYLLNSPRPWIVGDRAKARRAAVFSRDFTGRRSVVLLEEEPEGRE